MRNLFGQLHTILGCKGSGEVMIALKMKSMFVIIESGGLIPSEFHHLELFAGPLIVSTRADKRSLHGQSSMLPSTLET